MNVRAQRREAAIDRIADHLVERGLGDSGLRALAGAAGTSDRMLLYYFNDKDDVLAAALTRVAERLIVRLNDALPPGPRPLPDLTRAIWAIVGAPDFTPYMRLWLELAAAASRMRQPETMIASAIMAGFVDWARLRLADFGDEQAHVGHLLVMIEGALFLDAVGRRDLAEDAIRGA